MHVVSLDHLIGAREQLWRHVDAEGSRGRQVDDELEFARLDHRQVGRLLAFEDTTGIDTGLPVGLRQVRTIGHQTTGFRIVPRVVDAWQTMARGEGSDLDAPAEEKGVGSDDKRVNPLSGERRESRVYLATVARLDSVKL